MRWWGVPREGNDGDNASIVAEIYDVETFHEFSQIMFCNSEEFGQATAAKSAASAQDARYGGKRKPSSKSFNTTEQKTFLLRHFRLFSDITKPF